MNGLGKSRKRAGLTQKEAAKQSGISLGTLRNWEQGIYEPDADSLVKLAELYKCSTDDLLDSPFSSFLEKASIDPERDAVILKKLGEYRIKGYVETAYRLSDDERLLVDCFRKCTPARREMLLSMARDARDASIRQEQVSESSSVMAEAI